MIEYTFGYTIGDGHQIAAPRTDEPSREPERRSRADLKWTIFRRRPVSAVVRRTEMKPYYPYTLAFLIAGAVIIGVVVAIWPERRTYDPSEVKILARGTTPEGYQLEFLLPDDPGFYCPGVNFRRNESQLHFSFVRSRQGQIPDVDLPLITAHSGNDAVVFPYPDNWYSGETIELIDETGRKLGPVRLVLQ